ncbi:MAG: ComF family protein [Candidatus Nanopelagicaceae bacterium]|nr:ComF family protein [Candidatus Nanopelagicaceae bacterium]
MFLNGLREVAKGLQSLLFPEICIVCEREYVEVCDQCITPWRSSPKKFTINSLQIHAAVPYGNEVSGVVLKAKEDGLRIAQKLLADALTRSIISWGEGVDLKSCVLVPIPSSKKAIRRRGGSFLHPILQISTNELKRRGFRSIEWKELLKHRRSVLDQSQLNFEQRKSNLNNAFQMIRNDREIKAITNKKIILIDDVVTSGATLLSAESTLRERKMTVLGAATACASAHHLLIR